MDLLWASGVFIHRFYLWDYRPTFSGDKHGHSTFARFNNFLGIHLISAKFTRWAYFKRYVEPIPIFLPINLISMWAPLLSLTLRLFGNAIAGWTLMTIIEIALRNLSSMIFSFMPVEPDGLLAGNWNEIFILPIPKAVLSLYFDLSSALIQTFVFILLTTIFIGQEIPEDFSINTLERRT